MEEKVVTQEMMNILEEKKSKVQNLKHSIAMIKLKCSEVDANIEDKGEMDELLKSL